MRSQRGFTLIEVVVAFVLLALVLSVSFEIFSTGMARAGGLQERAQALVVAQSRLAMTGAEEAIKEGVTSGESEDRRFQWTVTVARADAAPTRLSAVPPSSAYALYRVDVRVTWRGSDSHDHAMDMATFSVGPKPT
ncbi:MAG TPA: prepilin-type N-terminal cleavage/methylation domain-containing protein [Usitatibacter sp.]|nr:prepilin-type N-terminal cleavage/methylation domain-containing protein [Usitatibacter sp.]